MSEHLISGSHEADEGETGPLAGLARTFFSIVVILKVNKVREYSIQCVD